METEKRFAMNVTRKIIVNLLSTVAFVCLFLLLVIGFFASTAQAGSTAQTAASQSGDYVFFIVQNEDVPLAAMPATDVSTYILWIGLAAFAITILFIYSAWYLSIRKNIRELSYKLSPIERRAFKISQGFFHPVRSYQLAKEAEDTVASMYVNYI